MKIDFSSAWKNGSKIIDSSIGNLPNLLIAAVVFLIFVFLASIIKSILRSILSNRKRRQNLTLLLGQLAQTAIIVLGFLVAFSVVAPSFTAGDLIKMLGIGSVAIGFAFQNILQNFLAGIILLIQEPFEIGDFINVTGLEGRVDDIQARSTLITGADGQRIVIPNAVLFTNPVTIERNPAEQRDTRKPPAAA